MALYFSAEVVYIFYRFLSEKEIQMSETGLETAVTSSPWLSSVPSEVRFLLLDVDTGILTLTSTIGGLGNRFESLLG